IRLPTSAARELAKGQGRAVTAEWERPSSVAMPSPSAAAEGALGLLRRRGVGKLIWFVLAVVIPTAISATYFFGVAADTYVSEFYAVVRPVSETSDSGPAASFTSVTAQTALESNVVVQYIKSPQIVG